MHCTSCGAQLPVEVAHCPICGAVTSYGVSESGIAPYDPTAASSPYSAPLQAPPPPDYGSPPYGVPQQSAYAPLNPYDVPAPPSTDYGSPPYGVPQQSAYAPLNPYDVPVKSPPPPQRQVKIGIITGIVVSILLLASGSLFAWLILGAKNTPSRNTSTPTATTAQTNLTATVTSGAITATSTANIENIPYPPYRGTLVLNDPLHDNNEGYNWQEASDSNGGCAFTGGAYHTKTLRGGYYYPCTAGNTDFANFAYEVQMKIMKGDCGAILFRVDRSLSNFYYFRVCQDGSYALFLYSNTTGSTLIPSHSNSAIHASLNQSNLVAVVAQGSTLDLYINQQHIDSISDSTYTHGQIAVVADGFPGSHPTEVAYSNAKVWKL